MLSACVPMFFLPSCFSSSYCADQKASIFVIIKKSFLASLHFPRLSSCTYLVAIKLWSAANRAQGVKFYWCLSQMWDFGIMNRSLFENPLLLSCWLHNPNSITSI